MPFELFPASRGMDRGKRKRGDDADHHDATAGNQKDSMAGGGKEAETATDEEVEEFFAILKRLHAATKYIEKIDGASRLLMGKRSKPAKSSEEEADEEEIPEHKLDRNLDLDLNLEPASVESDGEEMSSRSQNPNPSSVDSRANSRRK